MTAPSEPGYYWCAHFVCNSLRPVILEVYWRGRDTENSVLSYNGPGGPQPVAGDDPEKVKWGERIPTNNWLKALRELSENLPYAYAQIQAILAAWVQSQEESHANS